MGDRTGDREDGAQSRVEPRPANPGSCCMQSLALDSGLLVTFDNFLSQVLGSHDTPLDYIRLSLLRRSSPLDPWPAPA